MLTSETIAIDDTAMLFAFVVLPEGSTLVVNDKRLDSKRGVLIFRRGEFLYIAMTQKPESLFTLTEPGQATSDQTSTDADVLWNKESLQEFYKTIVFH